jgi:carbamoyl-phosphate synthase, small subunit
MKEKMLVTENGKAFYGEGFGADCTKIAEIVFNTSMVGYQEILSDPANCGQMIVMSYPLIGNYGLADEDYESKGIYLDGFIVREYNDFPSNFRYTKTLSEAMADAGVAGIAGVDTREIVKMLRDEGTMRAMITDADRCIDECVFDIKKFAQNVRPIEIVSTKKIWYARTRNPETTLVAVDCGVEYNIIRKFNQSGCNVAVVPFNTPKEEILKLKPDGIYVSSGSGNPAEISEVVGLIKELRGKLPILGVGLGSLLIGLAYGAKSVKMKFGHRGANQPVKNLKTGKVEITVQNHAYSLLEKSLRGVDLEVTHVNLLSGEAEAFRDFKNDVIGVQFALDGSDGPEDSVKIFSEFVELMRKSGGNKNAQENRY